MIQNPISFIANIVLVAHADGKLSPSELIQLEAVRTELKLKKSDLTAAIKLVESGNHKMTPVGSFVDQVRNLDFILRVAYADEDLNDVESSLVNDFVHAAGIYPDQLEKVRQDVMTFLKDQGKVCSACGTSSNKDARFCPKCGMNLDNVVADEGIHNELKIPGSGLAIEFAESSAASFSKALEIAKALPGFQSCLRNKKPWYLAVYPSAAMTDAVPLCGALSGIRNRHLYFDGKETPWDEVFGFIWCAERRATAYRPVEYCFGKDENRLNPWGCKQANLEWSDWARWFCYGRWEKGGLFGGKVKWLFDKERIRHELATNLFRYRFCPHLRTDLSEAVLKYFPDTITPELDSNWGFHKIYDEMPGSIKVKEKGGSGDFSFTNEYFSDGVCPKGLRGLKDILTKALQDLEGSPISVNNLIT